MSCAFISCQFIYYNRMDGRDSLTEFIGVFSSNLCVHVFVMV